VREVLPTLDACSVDAVVALQREVHPVPLDVHMARMTQANNVVEGVGGVRIIKGADWNDVMHVWCSPRWVVICTAPAAGVVVSNTGRSPECTPVGSIVAGVAAAPSGIVRACAVRVATWQRTKSHPTLAMALPLDIIKLHPAIQARCYADHTTTFGRPCRRDLRGLALRCVFVRLHHDAPGGTDRSPREMTFPRAKLTAVGALDCCRRACKGLATSCTRQQKRCRQVRCTQRIRARAATGRLATMFQAGGVSFVLFAALWALASNHEGIISR